MAKRKIHSSKNFHGTYGFRGIWFENTGLPIKGSLVVVVIGVVLVVSVFVVVVVASAHEGVVFTGSQTCLGPRLCASRILSLNLYFDFKTNFFHVHMPTRPKTKKII